MSPSDAQALLDEITETPRFEPNKWECDFLDSIRGIIDEGLELSEKQGDSLEKLYRKSQGG